MTFVVFSNGQVLQAFDTEEQAEKWVMDHADNINSPDMWIAMVCSKFKRKTTYDKVP